MSSLTTIEKEFGIFLKKSRDGKLRKYKLIGNRYIKICENKNCLKIAKSGDIHCYNFINQGICSKDEAGEERVLTEKMDVKTFCQLMYLTKCVTTLCC